MIQAHRLRRLNREPIPMTRRKRLLLLRSRIANGRMTIRSGAGLGDAIYLQSIARHFVATGKEVEVCTRYPEVFRQMKPGVSVAPFRRDNVTHVAHYTGRKGIDTTDQFRDCCICAGISEPVELSLQWQAMSPLIGEQLRSAGKPVIAVQLPRTPMNRRDGFGAEILPDCKVIQRVIDYIGDRATFVQIGSGAALFRFTGINIDLANKTTVSALFDASLSCDGFLGYPSFIVPLAESQKTPALLVWSRRGLRSNTVFVRRITPKKLLHRPETSSWIVDDCTQQELESRADAFFEQVRASCPV